MKKITPIILLALCLLIGCKASLSTQVDDECKKCEELLSKNLCGPKVNKPTVTKGDSAITNDSVASAKSIKPNPVVVNSAVNAFGAGDELENNLDKSLPREKKDELKNNWREGKAILGKNIDRHCPDIPPYSRVDLDHYYSEVSYINGQQTHKLYRKAHNVTVTTTVVNPTVIHEPSCMTHWYFWVFVVESLFILYLIISVVSAILKPRK
jgi:hypothetical protein